MVGTPRTTGASPPVPYAATLLRPRLLEPLLHRFEYRVIALVADAGFGKSTLLARALQENALQPRGVDCWLAVTPDHAAVSVLTEDLLREIGLPVAAASAADLPQDPAAAAALIADAVWRQAPAQVALVLDDVHHLPSDSAGSRLISLLANRLPGNGHLVLASRGRPPVAMTKLLSTGQALLLQGADLAFSDQELLEFAERRGIDPDLLQGLDGWPALAELVAVTGHRDVAGYLWEEVLDALAPDRLEVLALLVALDGADDDLASQLLGRPVDLGRTMAGLALISVTEDGWWTPHRLWADALSDRGTPPAVEAAIAEAPSALLARGRLRQAMRLLIASGGWQQAADVLVRACSGLTAAVSADVLTWWWQRLPERLREQPAGLLVAGTAAKADDPSRASELLRRSAEGFAADRSAAEDAECGEGRDLALRGELAALLGLFHIAFWRNQISETRQVLRRWNELAADGAPGASMLASLGRAILAATPAAARAELARLPTEPDAGHAVLVGWVRAHLELLTLGDVETAIAVGRPALAAAPASLRPSIRCELVEAYRSSGQVAAARLQAELLAAELQSSVIRSPRHLAALVVLDSVTREPAEASLRMPDLIAAERDSLLPWASLAVAVATAALEVARGQEEAASRSLDRLIDHPMALPLVLPRISLAAIPLQYVLTASSRAMWDEAELHGTLATVRTLARAVVAAREGGPPSAIEALREEDLVCATSALPRPWATLIGVARWARDHRDGLSLVQQLGPESRSTLKLLDTSGGVLGKAARRMLSAIPAPPRHRVSVQIFGPLRVARDDLDVEDANLRRERVRQLLGLLVLKRSVSRVQICAALWPELSEADAGRNLRVTLNYLQRVLEPDRDERDAPFFLRARGTSLELVPGSMLNVDLWEFETDLELAEDAERSGAVSAALPAYLRAAERLRGELLEDVLTDQWMAMEQDRLRRRAVAAVIRAGELLLASGDDARAETMANRALATDAWSEQAYQLLVEALLSRGDRGAARRTLDRCFDMLTGLNLAASPETSALATRLRTPRQIDLRDSRKV